MEGANNDPNKAYNMWDEIFIVWYINGRWSVQKKAVVNLKT